MKRSLFAGLSKSALDKRKKITQPPFIPPMLATLTTDYFSSNEWVYEHKFDGERCQAIKKDGAVRLLSRNRRVINNEYPDLVKAFEKQRADNFIVDGEIVATHKGLSDFELLQSRINLKDLEAIEAKTKEVPVSLRIFDLMYASGYDLRKMPLLARKAVLKKLLNYNDILTYTEHKVGDAIAYFKKACQLHWEGLIVKKSDSIYEGIRSPHWLKFKCIMQQELVIGGYTSPKGGRTDLGALLVGYYAKNKKLKFAGKVGTGYSEETLRMLGKKLRAIAAKKCPFSDYDGPQINVHWVRPILVGEFGFAQWTNAGKLRVGRYRGLRNDKSAKDVVKEVPKKFIHIPK